VDSTEWNAEEQIEHLTQAAIAHVRLTMGNTLRRDADRWSRRQPRDSFISMTMKVDSRPQHVGIPPAAGPVRLKFTCSVCECRYVVIGAAYFCPSRGTADPARSAGTCFPRPSGSAKPRRGRFPVSARDRLALPDR